LLALSGFQYDMVRGHVGFDPAVTEAWSHDGEFRCFWSLGRGWGTYSFTSDRVELTVLQGELTIRSFGLPSDTQDRVRHVMLAGHDLEFRLTDRTLFFSGAVSITPSSPLTVTLGR